jgi:RNA polymerase sigma-70 factor (ECF subfamily)
MDLGRTDEHRRRMDHPAKGVALLDQDFEAVFNEHARFVYRTAYGVTGSHEDAEDILQTVFMRVLGRDLPHDVARNPRAYLYRAAVNLSLDTIRMRRRYLRVEDEKLTELPAPADSTDDLIHRRLYQAIAELKPETAQILILRYVHDRSDAEIARMLGVSRGTIALRLFRSRARLKKLLGAHKDRR